MVPVSPADKGHNGSSPLASYISKRDCTISFTKVVSNRVIIGCQARKVSQVEKVENWRRPAGIVATLMS